MKVILASSSQYRQHLLRNLNIPFEAFSPNVDESRLPGESPISLVKRLAVNKAKAVAQTRDADLVIGSDQVAEFRGRILGKPHTRENAIAQLTQFSGSEVSFLTSVCLYDSRSDSVDIDVVTTQVVFRRLTAVEIERYVDIETPFDCAGSFKSEGLGISLFASLRSEDPNALVGLPLIRLNHMLLAKGVNGLR